jgi:hypothetical protein
MAITIYIIATYSIVMVRPRIWIPMEDLKGLKTLRAEGKTALEISEYFRKHGLYVSRRTVNDRIQELEQ